MKIRSFLIFSIIILLWIFNISNSQQSSSTTSALTSSSTTGTQTSSGLNLNLLESNGCGITNETEPYEGPIVKGIVTITSCTHSGSIKCNFIANRTQVTKGDIIYSTYNNGDNFKYVGDNTLCYSIKYRSEGCLGMPGTSTCLNYCVKYFPHNSTGGTVVKYSSVYDYYCSSLWQSYYTFSVVFIEDDDPSNSIKLTPTRISIFLISILSLSLLLLSF